MQTTECGSNSRIFFHETVQTIPPLGTFQRSSVEHAQTSDLYKTSTKTELCLWFLSKISKGEGIEYSIMNFFPIILRSKKKLESKMKELFYVTKIKYLNLHA